jgi:solute carrier family 8 (sodium/calcium exchanger)
MDNKFIESTNWSTTESVIINNTLKPVLNTIRIALSNVNTNPSFLTNSNISGNYTSIESNYSLERELSETDYHQCKDGLFLPFWPHNGHTGVIVFHGLVYFLALIYTFVGVAIIADRFMAAIEQITSQETDVIVRKPNGEKEIISVRIWNETVSNLTLMALGSSAPEILLSIIEIYAQNFEAGELGPGTIVGSAAFNMFVIIAICVWCVPSPTPKKIKHLRVFCITMAFSVFAYVWMLFILVWSTPGVIEIWEGFLTFAFFPLTVLVAYIADRRLLIYKYLDKRYRMKNVRKTVYGGSDSEGENVELTAVDANGIKAKVNDIDVKGDLKVSWFESSLIKNFLMTY